MIHHIQRKALCIVFLISTLCFSHSNTFGQAAANDPSFNPTDVGFAKNEGPNAASNSIYFQGSIIQPDGKVILIGLFTAFEGIPRGRIARLNQDGTLDLTFATGAGADNYISSVLLLPDGKLMIVGQFTTFDGVARNRIARLNSNGSLDLAFDPGLGADQDIVSISQQADGKLLIGGNFTQYQGVAVSRITRINADGTLDSGFINGLGANNIVSEITIQADNKIIIGGSFTSINGVTMNRIARLNSDGSLDAGFIIGTGLNSTCDGVLLQTDGNIILTGNFITYNGTTRSRIVRIDTNGTLDASFDPGTGANNWILSSRLQPDGKIIVAGNFDSYNGVPRGRIARLNSDGTLDLSFDPGSGANSFVTSIALQSDGKIIVEGLFFEFNNTARNSFLRLNADGSIDGSFGTTALYGANGSVRLMIAQPDGKIIISGPFVSYNGVQRKYLARLNQDGTLDLTFNPDQSISIASGVPNILAMALQADGKLVIGGNFTAYNGISRNRIARINADGTLDTTFDPGTGVDNGIQAAALQPDGKIIIGGSFILYNGTTRNRIARLNSDGSLDNTFDPGTGLNAGVSQTVLQPDGKIIIAGSFASYNGIARTRIARINSDGTLDATFDPGTGADNLVGAVALQADGKIIIGGNFTTYNGTTIARIARLNSGGTLDGSFNVGSGLPAQPISIELQADGKILIGGVFTSYNGITVNRLARLASDGTLDQGFDCSIGANNTINDICFQSQSKLLIGGNFISYNGEGRNRIARILLTGGTTTPADSLALVSVYNSTNGVAWINRSNWLSGNVRSWYGVKLLNGRVNSLQLNGNNLVGNIPIEIGTLTKLDSLYLNGNKLTGTIPSQIGALTELKVIDLGVNQLSGSFPSSIFTLTQLSTFGFAGNQISGTIPASVGNLVNLVNFWIDSNKISGPIPNEINNLVNLKNFYIQNNEFTFVPALTGFSLIGGSIQSNFLDFNSLPLNVATPNLQYNGQKQIPVGTNTSVAMGGAFTLTYNAGGTGTTYQWVKNYVDIGGQTANIFSVSAAVPSSAGNYWLKAQNPSVPGLILETTPFVVEVTSQLLNEESGYSYWKKLGAEELGSFQYQPKEVAAGNFVFVHDYIKNKIHKFDLSGNLLLSWDLTNNAFSGNGDMSVDSNDALYISSEGPSNLVKYDANGNFVYEITNTNGAYGNAISPSGDLLILPRNGPTFVLRKYDKNTGQFLTNVSLTGTAAGIYLDIETDLAGNIYAIDPNGSTYGFPKLDKYSSTGTFISSIDLKAAGMDSWHGWHFSIDPSGEIYVQTQGWGGAKTYQFDAAGNFVRAFTSVGSSPYDLAITAQGIIVSDMEEGMLLYNSSGVFLNRFGPQKDANGQFNFAVQMTADSKGFRYIADRNNNRIQKFNSNGVWINSFGSLGSGPGQLNSPRSVATDRFNNIYVADYGNNRVQKLSSSGTFLLEFGVAGSANGQFSGPNAIVISKNGEVIVGDRGNHRVQIFKPDGTFVSTFGSNGVNDGQFNFIEAIAIENDGTILISDSNTRLQRFSPQGQFISSLSMQGAVNFIGSLATDIDGFLYIPDNNIAKKFDRNGGLVAKIGTPPTNAFADGELRSLAVHSNISGDTLWISDYNPTQRISIFSANFRYASVSDSLALVDLYNNTKGNSWTNKTNWLVGAVNTWYGVKMSSGKVREINLSNNLLDGPLPSSFISLDNLLTINFSNNKLTGSIPDWNTVSAIVSMDLSKNILSGVTSNLPSNSQKLNLSENQLTDVPALPVFIVSANLSKNQISQLGNLMLTNQGLDTLRVQQNKLTFEDLEPNLGIKSFTYSPQDSVSLVESVLKQLGESATFTATTGGSSNQYQWKKNGTSISGATNTTLTLSNITFNDDGIYQASITSSLVPNLTLQTLKKTLRVSSLKRDSIALRGLYTLANGASWTTKTNWLTTPLSTGNWFGVTITNNRVSAVSLPNNNLVGRAPLALADLQNVTTLNLSNNKITFIPDLKTLTSATAINISGNRLDFESIVPNSKLAVVNYASQADIGTATTDLVDYGNNFTVKVSTKGDGNIFKWKRNGTIVPNAIDSTYQITAINRNNMGDYIAEITNAQVPGFTLKSATKKVLAVASVSGKIFAKESTPASKGKNYLLRVIPSAGYDTLGVKDLLNDGSYKYEKVILGDYQVAAFIDTVTYKKALPTFYKGTILWEEADKLAVDKNEVDIDITSLYKPLTEPQGIGVISGVITEQTGGGRGQGDRRVKGAGAMVRKVERTGRGQGEILTLVAYVFSNDDGEFVLPKLTKGEYRLNIQYPGYPMDETSYVTIPIGDGLQSQVKVSANVADGKIKVKKLIVTGIWEQENYVAEAYPNPSTEYVHLRFNNTSTSREAVIVDVTGKTWQQQAVSEREAKIDVRMLPSGVYILQVTEDGQLMKSIRVMKE